MTYGRMDMDTIHEINSRLYFGSGTARGSGEVRPWQYVEMEYDRMGLSAPSYVPRLETLEDAEIWMCLDARVNRSMRMMETPMAG